MYHAISLISQLLNEVDYHLTEFTLKMAAQMIILLI